MARFIYTDEMLMFLSTFYKKHRIKELTALFNERFGTAKSMTAIKSALTNRGIRGGKTKEIPLDKRKLKYSVEQIEWLKQMYPSLTIRNLVAAFNNQFGTDETFSQVYTFLKNHKISSGRTGQFQKGSVSWNKGKKGLHFSPETQFKPGRESENKRPIGSERICTKDGYVMIKVAEPNKWRLKHRVVWEQLHGPVPAGHVIRFRDMDKTNITETNMTLVTRAEHAIINKLGINRIPEQYENVIKSVVKVRRASAERQRQQTKRSYRKQKDSTHVTRD